MSSPSRGLLLDCETSIFSKVCFQLCCRLRLHWLHSLPVIPGPGLHQPCLGLWKPGVGSFAKMTLVLWTPIVRARAFVTRMEWIRVFAISSLSRKYLARQKIFTAHRLCVAARCRLAVSGTAWRDVTWCPDTGDGRQMRHNLNIFISPELSNWEPCCQHAEDMVQLYRTVNGIIKYCEYLH